MLKTEDIVQLFKQFERVAADYRRHFMNAIDKAKESCRNVGADISDHFADVSKMVAIGSGAEKEIEDILLTRYACLLRTITTN